MYAFNPYQSRISAIISRNYRRLPSAVFTEPPKDPIIASSFIGNQPPPPPSEAPTLPPVSGDKKNSWSFLKYGLIAAVTGGVATASYATYAYSLDEVDQKTKAFRDSANFIVGEDASAYDVHKFQSYVRAAAVTVPAKLVDTYLDLRRLIEEHVRGFTEPTSDKLLPDLHPLEQHVFTLVLDLNKTLICSDWKRDRGWRTFKRPGVDAFLEHLAQFYEIVVYSDELSMYVDPVVERLDPKHCIRYRLSRGATRYTDGKHFRVDTFTLNFRNIVIHCFWFLFSNFLLFLCYIFVLFENYKQFRLQDLSMLNRDPAKVLYISGQALESCLQRENCVLIKQWEGEADDTVLLHIIPFLEYVAKHRPVDIRTVLASYEGSDIAKEFMERSKEHQRRMQEQKQHGHFWRR